MKDIFSKRIKSARILAGFSLRELSEKMDSIVSHNAIKKYEEGLMMPDSKVILQLAKALHVNTDFFFQPYTVNIEKIEFRKKAKLSVKDVNSIKESVTNSIEKYIELEGFLNVSSAFINPIDHLNINLGNDIEEAVNKLLEVWKIGINALPNVIELLEDKEIKVIELDADEAFDGLSGWANNNIPVIVINKHFSTERKRFTALHELGHLLLSFHGDLQKKEVEKLCHRFAGAMLMPQETFKNELGAVRSSISIQELIMIKETYGISIQAIMARAKDLGVINDERYINFRKFINRSEDNRKEIGLGIYEGKEHSSRYKQLLYRATAEEVISMSKAASLANQKLAQFRDDFIAI